MITTITGWLFDLYPNDHNLTIWFIGDDGLRHRFVQDFAVSVYAAGPSHRLRQLWIWLEAQPIPVRLSRSERKDIFRGMVTVLAVQVPQPGKLDGLWRAMTLEFPDLVFYDGDISIPLRYAAAFDVFPLARCRLELVGDKIIKITPLDSPWDLESELAPLRILCIEPDCDPLHDQPREVRLSCGRSSYSLPVDPEKPKALYWSLRASIKHHDPDLILTTWGDTWLLPYLIQTEQENGYEPFLNRDESLPVVERKENSYFSYGRIVHRGRQFQLRGRWQIDRQSAMFWKEYGLEGVFETARVTRQPVQESARLSPGTGISSMQFIAALQNDILIPWHKHQAETPKTAMELIHSDMGGMVYQPTIGLHRDVCGIDFTSMYPGMMVKYNISPEISWKQGIETLEPAPGEPGIVPLTLAPLLKKRLALKTALMTIAKLDCRREAYHAMACAEKWLLVTCFGYLGYRNARFGRIEAHEAVTAYGREALLRAKETAEDMDYEILHMYIDGLWVKKPGNPTMADHTVLLTEITERTGLPICMDGIYKWVVFLASRVDERVPVPNRYFGVFQDGTIKVRGIEARRRDTAPFVAGTQMGILEILAKAPDAEALADVYPKAVAYHKKQVEALRAGRIPLEELVISHQVSRELDKYSSPSPAARVARQLVAAGRTVQPGQRVRFLYTLGVPGVHAWDIPERPDVRSIDLVRYRVLLDRAAETVLAPVRQSISGGEDNECLYLFPNSKSNHLSATLQ